MKNSLIKVFLSLALTLLGLQSYGQIQVSNAAPYNDPDYLVQNVLLGPGVPFLPNFPAPPTSVQIGRFWNGNSFGFGIDSGIVLISGNATDAMPGGPFSTGFGATPDADLVSMLTSINSSSTVVNDGAFIEFDFVATGDSVSFNYIFASYEYSGYTCSPFNDPFGFFLSGAGINGNPGVSTVNLAQVPGTNPPVPVAVNTLNQGFPSGSYPAATCQAANPVYVQSAAHYVAHPNSNNVNATGYSVPLRARAQVTCGNLYHIKLAVADVSDQALHSMAFLEARSFKVPSVQFTASTNHNNSFSDSLMVEGCNAAYLKVEKAGNINQPLTVNFTLTGTATEGADYANLPDSIYIAAGVRVDSIPIISFDDGVAEGLETIEINTQQIVTPCYTYAPQQIVFTIRDRQMITSDINLLQGSDTLDCPNTAIQIEGLFSGGDGHVDGAWDNGSIMPVRWDTLLEDQTYYFYSWDECSADSVVDSLTIYVRESIPMIAGTDSSWSCPGGSATLNVSYSGGTPPLTFMWWDQIMDTSRTFAPTETTYYPFQVSDVCGNIIHDTAVIFIPDPVVASFSALEDPTIPLSIDVTNFSQNATDFQWEFGDGNTSNVLHPQHTYSRPGIYNIQLLALDQYGCSDSAWREVDIKQDFDIFIPTAFTPNGDGINDHFVIHGGGISTFHISIFSRWGELVYSSDNITEYWDGTFKGQPVPDGVFYYVINLRLEDERTHTERGSLHLHH